MKTAAATFFILLCSVVAVRAQSKIELLNANSLEYDEQRGNAKRLIGDVQMKHENSLLYCDSAYLYPNNTMEAHGHVRIIQPGGAVTKGNVLKYDGNSKKGELTGNVIMIDKETQLTTDAVFFDFKTNVASYYSGGIITNKSTILKSKIGHFNSKTKEYFFKTDVTLVDPDYRMWCDTLKYNSSNKTAYFSGPTKITNNENTILCTHGWYDMQNDRSMFNKRATIFSNEQQLQGDSIFFDKKNGIGKSWGNVVIKDSLENLVITGDFSENRKKTETSVVTGKALLMQIQENDTLFLHGDTLKSTFLTKDSSGIKVFDYSKRILYAYKKVKFYKNDMQGKADSLVYTYADSTMRLYNKPVLWNLDSQISADSISFVMSKGQINKMFLKQTAFIISKEDSIRYNQIKGKDMTGYFHNNKLNKILVEGNGQTVYYAKEKNKLIGVNRATCTSILIVLKEDKINRITFMQKPEATLFPIGEISPAELQLKDFKNRFDERPLSKQDLFN